MSLNRFRVIEEKKRFEKGERQELEHKLAPLKVELSKTLKRADAATRMFFSQPLRHLADLIDSGTFEADHGVTFPRTDERQNGTRGRAEYTEFVANLPKSGFLLSSAGAQRLLIFVLSQAFSENHADLANSETYRIAFDRLYQLGCFDEEKAEIGYDESIRVQEPVVAQPERELTLDDLEGLNTSTKAGEAKARDIISSAVFDGEAKQVFRAFIAHVSRTFGHDLTEGEQREIVSFFQRNNKSFLDKRAYDLCRVNLVRRGILNHQCLTEDELLSQEIEQEDTTSYEGRRNLMQQIVAARRKT